MSEEQPHPRVIQAVHEGGVVTLDARGLMPLEKARRLLSRTKAFAKGEGVMSATVGSVLDSDRLWAALLSLEDGEEFVRVASRLRWEFHPRGMENVDLALRYGRGILPWIATRLLPDGTLMGTPWCVVPCLLSLDDELAFELVWRARAVQGGIDIATTFIARHPETSLRALARLASSGDARARNYLRAECARDDRVPFVQDAAFRLGDIAGMQLLRELGIRGPLVEGAILSLFDACAERVMNPRIDLWPRLVARRPESRCHALRLLAGRAKDGDGWGVVIERLEGDHVGGKYPAHVGQFFFGSAVPRHAAVRSRAVTWDAAPKKARGDAFRVALRRDLERAPGLFWPSPEEILPALGLEGGSIIVATTSFAHVDEGRPSTSETYASLARALVTRDAAHFVPGRAAIP